MKVLITGATGFVGGRLIQQFPGAVALSRSAARAREALPAVNVFEWHPMREPAPTAAFDGVDAVFHLLGEPVAGWPWTAARKRRIRDSRVIGTRHLVQTIASLPKPPRVLVASSAVGYYGSRGDEILDEHSSPDDSFLADVCREWELEAATAETAGVRVVSARTGLVLGTTGGSLVPIARAFRLGLGGRLGSGDQWMPWVHIDDMVGLLQHAANAESVRGAMNAVGPQPVTNAEFTRTLASVLHRPAFMHAPAFALRLALGQMSEIILSSQRVVPTVAQETGYRFQHAELRGALEDLLG